MRTRKRLLLGLFTGLLLIAPGLATVVHAPTAAAQGKGKKLNVQEVIRLTEAGIPDKLIINRIRQTKSVFNLTVDDMIKLKKAGVSDAVIEEMVQTEMHKGPVGAAKDEEEILEQDNEEEKLFGKANSTPVQEWTTRRGSMKDAAKLYREGSYPEASDILFTLIEEGRVRGNQRCQAQYYLAESLYNMGFYQGSQYYYRETVKCGPKSEFFGKGLLRMLDLSERLRDERTLQVLLQDIDPRLLPSERKNDFFYHYAIIAFKKGNTAQAFKWLRAIPQSSAYYRKAKYTEGVLLSLDDKNKQAVEAFKTAALSAAGSDARVELEARLAVARTLYQAERYEDAVETFRGIAVEDTDVWATSLFENGWALYKSKDFASSLGNLKATEAPFFDTYYNPEGEVLGAIAFYRLCRFRDAEDTIQVFFRKYAPISAKLKAFRKGARKRKPKQVFALVYEYVYSPQKGATFLPDNVMATIASNGKIEDVLFQMRVLDLEQQRIRSFGDLSGGGRIVDASGRQVRAFQSSWRSSRVAQWLYEQLQEHKEQLMDFGGRLVVREVGILDESLDDFLAQSKTIRFEITYAEKEQLEASLRGEAVPGHRTQTEPVEIVAPDDHYYWPFEGEYWKDEIGYYTYAVKSECVKK